MKTTKSFAIVVIFTLMLSFLIMEGVKAEDVTISVMLPPWAELPSSELAKFTEQTGIEVELSVVGWDEIHNKIVIASAGNTAVADVVEVDWSWIGEFGATGWFEPLNDRISDDRRNNMPLIKTFTSNEQVLALPYMSDFRIGSYNREHFEKAGISSVPTTWDEVYEVAKQLKSSGVIDYPLGFPLSASEATVTSFVLLSLSMSGELFDENSELITENAEKTLAFIKKVNDEQLLSPGMASMVDREVYQNFYNTNQSFMFGGPAHLILASNPEKSKSGGKTGAMLVPGGSGIKTNTFGLPEGIGIPKFSENKEAAWKFIEWFTSEETERALYAEHGLLPGKLSIMTEIQEKGELPHGETIIKQASYISTIVPKGLPSWYPQFSKYAGTLINQMVTTDSLSPSKAASMIAEKVTQLNSK